MTRISRLISICSATLLIAGIVTPPLCGDTPKGAAKRTPAASSPSSPSQSPPSLLEKNTAQPGAKPSDKPADGDSLADLLQRRNPDLIRYWQKHGKSLVDEAIGRSQDIPLNHGLIAAQSRIRRMVESREVPRTAAEALVLIRLARIVSQISRQPSGLFRDAPALTLLGIRKAHAGLVANPERTEFYLALGMGYSLLARFESKVVLQGQQPLVDNLRYLQAVTALNQVLAADPNNLTALQELRDLYGSAYRYDLQLRTVNSIDTVYARIKDNLKETEESPATKRLLQQIDQEVKLNSDLKDPLERIVEKVEDEISRLRASDRPAAAIFAACVQNGCFVRALQELNVQPRLAQDPEIQIVRLALLLETGELPRAQEVAGKIYELGMAGRMSNIDWEFSVANGLLPSGEHNTAARLLTNAARQSWLAGMASLLNAARPRTTGDPLEPWPVNSLVATSRALNTSVTRSSEARLRAAQILVEAGDLEAARENLEAILADHPDFSKRPLVAYYLWLLTGKVVDTDPPSNRVPILFESSPDKAQRTQ